MCGVLKILVITGHETANAEVNVWCAITHRRVIGPFFFVENTITSTSYLYMLEWYAVQQIQELNPGAIFQQDGAPPHWGLPVGQFLDMFPASWTRRGGPIAWPARSLDLTAMDFFLWVYTKDQVYHTRVTCLQDLNKPIAHSVEGTTPQMCGNVFRASEYWTLCKQQKKLRQKCSEMEKGGEKTF
jgi:hypothetical protein